MSSKKLPTLASSESVIAEDPRWRPDRAPTPPVGAPGADPEHDTPAELFDWALLRDRASFLVTAPRRHVLLALAAFLVAVALSVAALAVLPRTYHVEARILASRNLVMPALGNPGRNIPGDADAPTRGAIETILRRENLLALVAQTNLVSEWARTRAPLLRAKDFVLDLFRPRADDEEKRDALVHVLEKRLKVSVSGDAKEALTIEIDWPDAVTGYRLVSMAQQNFLETRHALEVSTIAETISILEGHAAVARGRVDSSLEEFRRARDAAKRPALAKPVQKLPVVRPSQEDREVANLKLMLVAKRRAIADLEEFRDRKLAELQARLAEQKATYTSAHPQVVATRESLEALGRDSPQLAELRREEHELLSEYLARGGKQNDSERAEPVGAATAPMMRIPDVLKIQDSATEDTAEAQYWRTQLEVSMRKYEELAARVEAARIELDTARAAFKYRYSVVRPAEVPRKPSSPNVAIIVLAGIFGGVVLAFAATCWLDVRRGVFLQAWQVERQLGVPLLAEIDPR